MTKGFVYLTAVVDVTSKRVISHKAAITLEVSHAKEVLQQALSNYDTPQIVITDQGNQVTTSEFTEVALNSGVKLSMDGRGAWRDNVLVERV